MSSSVWTCPNCAFTANLESDATCFVCHQGRPALQAAPDVRPAERAVFGRTLAVLGATLLVIGGGTAAVILYGATPNRATPQIQEVAGGQSSAAPASTSTASDAPGTYTVRPGDTFYGIAGLLGVTEPQLRWWNLEKYPSLRTNPRDLVVGWVLITEGEPMPTPKPRPTPRPPTPAPPPPAGTALVPLPLLVVDVWNAGENYYPITFTDPNEMRASAAASIPVHPDGANALAYVNLSMSVEPATTFDPYTGACRVVGVHVAASPLAIMPQWVAPSMVHPALLEWWGAVLDHITWHESQHVRIYEEHLAQLHPLVYGQDCSAVAAIVNQWAANLEAAQDAFDATEANWGANYPYTGPWTW